MPVMPVQQAKGRRQAVIFCLSVALLASLIYLGYPFLLAEVIGWQKQFNLSISQSLNAVQQAPQQAGMSLMLVSFLYGVFHAIGPGHGKFILASYLSLEQTQIRQTVRITLLSALVQGLVAIGLVTLLIVGLTLSRRYFNLTLLWVERGSFLLMIAFGGYWLWQVAQAAGLKKPKNCQNAPLVIHKLQAVQTTTAPQAVRFSGNFAFARHSAHSTHSAHSANCGCGHQHLPSSSELNALQQGKSVWLVIFSIGLRPCSGAILVLFLAYTLGIYPWGVASAMMMAIGTGSTLTAFALLVRFFRQQALKTSRLYGYFGGSKRAVFALKLLLALCLIGLGSALFHASFLENSTGLFKR